MLQNNEGAARGWQRESESTSYANEFSVIVAVDAAATVAVAAVREGCFSFFSYRNSFFPFCALLLRVLLDKRKSKARNFQAKMSKTRNVKL